MEEEKKDLIQTIVIILSNGKKGAFTGKCLVDKDEEGQVSIVDIKFTEPKCLPKGFEFMELKDVMNGG
jgi:hypothetical protein